MLSAYLKYLSLQNQKIYKMKKILYIFLFAICFSNTLAAQSNVYQVLKTYRTSIQFPYYYQSKSSWREIAKDIKYVRIEDGKMMIQYSLKGDKKKRPNGTYVYPEVYNTNIITVQFDIATSKVKKGDKSYDYRVWIENDNGITVTQSIDGEFTKDTFLQNSFSLETNSQALKDKLFNELNNCFMPYLPKQKKTSTTKQVKEKSETKAKTISDKYIQ